jgi:hypothetical protein
MSIKAIQQQVLALQGQPEAGATFFSVNAAGNRQGHGRHSYGPRPRSFKYVDSASNVITARQADRQPLARALQSSAAARAAYSPPPGILSRMGSSMSNTIGQAMKPQTKMLWNANVAAAKFNGRVAMAGLGVANDMSKMFLKASLPQIGVAAGITAGIGYGIMSATGVSGSQLADVGRSVHEGIKASARPVYGYSALGMSTQGLTFGLHNRRTG